MPCPANVQALKTVHDVASNQLLVHGKVTIIFVLSVCAEFFSAVFDPIWIKLGYMLHVRV